VGHEIMSLIFAESISKKEIQASCDRTAISRGEYHKPLSPIRFFDDVICKSYNEAYEYLREKDTGFYAQLAVRYREPSRESLKNSKKLVELEAKCRTAYTAYRTANEAIATKDFKSQLISCKGCGSKLNREYLKTNFCPLCHNDMRSDTLKKKIAQLKAAHEKAQIAYDREKDRLAEKNGEIKWLVKIEYHV